MDNETKIEIGSVVVLMSGGPSMTVIRIYNGEPFGTGPSDGPIYRCIWFNSEGKAGEAKFPEGAIKLDPRHKVYVEPVRDVS
jgi:uncharacterized protein YodC (DUF2158 family)